MRQFLLSVLLVLFAASAYAQGGTTIMGRVIDRDTRAPLIGVAVVVDNTATGTSTNEQGRFEINVNTLPATLNFSYIGYQTISLPASAEMVVEMSASAFDLDDLVVVGYGTVRKSDLTGAVSSISGSDLSVLSTPNIQAGLQGRIAGVQVTSSGSVDGDTKVRIRGIGTINNSDPLYVVDGFPTSDISYLAPTDIESMEVLKDASASAIYGSRGANGVILVTTKRGALNQPAQVSANVYAGVRQASKTLDVLNGVDYALARKEAFANDDKSMDATQLALLDFVIDNNLKGTDWQKEILRVATVQNYNVGVRGGSENVRYNLSTTYNSEEGVIKNSFVDKLMVKLNTDYRIKKIVTLGTDVAFTSWDMSNIDLSNMYGSPLMLAARTPPVNSVYTQDGNWTSTMGQDNNPVRVVEQEKHKKRHGNKFVGNFFLNVDLMKGLSFRSTFGVDYTFNRNRDYTPEYFVSTQEQNARSSLYELRRSNLNWVWSNVATYQLPLPDRHRMTAMLGTEATYNKYEYIAARAYNVSENAYLKYISAAKDSDYVAYSDQGVATIFSTFVRLNYSFDNRYLITATLRNDASSKFAKDNRSQVFPSVSVGWNIKEEQFLSGWTPLYQLKLRGGWGQVGNQSSVGIGEYQSSLTNNLKYVFGDTVYEGRIPTTMSNPELKWETAEQYNIGLDAAFFKGRLTATLDYFVKDTKDMILTAPVPDFVGAEPASANVGSIRNKGFEFSINHENKVNDNFSYHVGINMAILKNKVTDLGSAGSINMTVYDNRLPATSRTEVGREIAYYYGYKTNGIFRTQEEIDNYTYTDANGNVNKIQPNAQIGDVKYIDRNNNGEIDEGDLTYLGSYLPDFSGGLSFGATYKGVFLNVFCDYVYGNQIANMNYYDLGSGLMDKNVLRSYYKNRWSEDNPNGTQPRLTTVSTAENQRFSDRYIENGSYFRLRNIQIGYHLPQRWLEKIRVQQASVYFSIDNLHTFTKYSGYNPDVTDQWSDPLKAGSDIGGTPLPRTFSLGLNFNF